MHSKQKKGGRESNPRDRATRKPNSKPTFKTFTKNGLNKTNPFLDKKKKIEENGKLGFNKYQPKREENPTKKFSFGQRDKKENGNLGFFRKQERKMGFLRTEKKGSLLEKNGKKNQVKVSSWVIVEKKQNGKEKFSSLESNNFKRKRKSEANPSLKVSSLEDFKKKKKNKGGEVGNGNEDKPKRGKRVIRIDPYDTSNKRLIDEFVLQDMADKKEKKKEEMERKGEEEIVGLSKNAEFRAIQPSPSILTFVEENLLGRRRDNELKRAGYNIDLTAPLDNIPFSTKTERERIEESAFRNRLEFFAAAKVSSSFPQPDLPEIAFAGRSNVGKSSLLNALTRQWGVVRTSDKPGLTQSINFFKLDTKLCLVDLPGYGFAYAKEEVKEAWEELVKEYVSTRIGLKRVCLLIDTKWGMKPRDMELIHLMERSETKYQIVLTKTDTVFPLDVARRAMQIEETLKKNRSVVQPTLMVSSKSGAGIGSLRTALAKLARFIKP